MNKIKYDYYCPVCGFKLDFLPWDAGTPSFEICPCCFIQFGYEDAAGGEEERRVSIYREYRDYWMRSGMIWNSMGEERPLNWDPRKQLQNIGIFIN